MGRPTLEKLGLVLNFKSSTADINGKTFSLQRSEKGHFLVSLMFDNHCNEKLHVANKTNNAYFTESELTDACEIVYGVVDEALYDVNKTAREFQRLELCSR